jgi:ribosomal protein S27AE
MVEFVNLTCPSCGGNLQLQENIERFSCGYCGSEHIVNRAGGVVSLSPVVEQLKKIHIGTDKTASELAIKRLKEEIANLDRKNKDLKAKLESYTYIENVLDYFNDKATLDGKGYWERERELIKNNDRIPELYNISPEEINMMIQFFESGNPGPGLASLFGTYKRKYREIIHVLENIKKYEMVLIEKRQQLVSHQSVVNSL